MQAKKLPMGISDFEQIIEENYYYVDKTLLIKDLIDAGTAVTLFPRPRRFGKTLNMTMLRYFFEENQKSRAHLFANLAVAKHPDIMQQQGKYPVIFLSFKEAKGESWPECWSKIKKQLDKELERFTYLLQSDFVAKNDKECLAFILSRNAPQSEYEDCLFLLSKCLTTHHKIKPIILIDEYDAPINAGYINKYYDDVMHFMRNFLSAGLKDNVNLRFAVMTGILRVAKESIFSGLNNLVVCSMLADRYSDRFGLLEYEVMNLVNYYQLPFPPSDIRQWYNGYRSGQDLVYNPWSIISLAFHKKLQPYWIHTSSNDIIKDLAKKATSAVQEGLGALLSGGKINIRLEDSIVFEQVHRNDTAVWNFMLFSGYLTFNNPVLQSSGLTNGDVFIPNKEVFSFFHSTIADWFEETLGSRHAAYVAVTDALTTGNVQKFSYLFQELVLDCLSYFDISGKQPEVFYHAFVLGLLVHLSDRYEVISNRESGYGRYDVSLIPKDKSKLWIILEFKKVAGYDSETLEEAAQRALDQIADRQHAQAVQAQGIRQILELGVAFEGKQIFIKSA